MRKILSVLIGTLVLAAAAMLLWPVVGPVAAKKVTTGGTLTTQQEIAQQGPLVAEVGPDLGVITDEGPSSTNAIGAQAQMAPGALDDASTFDAQELAAAPQTTAAGANLTTDIMLDADADVAVAPLSVPPAAVAPAAPDGQDGAGVVSATYEQRVVELEWPATLPVGRSGSVRVALRMLEDGSAEAVAEIADNEVIATPILLADRYDTHNAVITAVISAPDFEVAWLNNADQTLERGGEVAWRWTLTANEAGTSVIALTLTLNWIPLQQGTSQITTSIWGQALQIESKYVLGRLTISQASYAGTALAVVGFVLEIPLLGKLLEAFWNMLFGRRRRRVSRSRKRR